MKIKHDVITNILDKLTADEATQNQTSVAAVAQAVRDATGIEVPEKAVRAVLVELADVGECDVEKNKVTRYSPKLQAAWKRAGEVAELLGLDTEKNLSLNIDEANPSTFSLSLVEAEVLLKKLAVVPIGAGSAAKVAAGGSK